MSSVIKIPSVTVSALITAPSTALFAIISDITRHNELAGSGEVRAVRWLTDGPARVGSVFASQQQIGPMRYQTRSSVQEYDAPSRFVWLSGFGFQKLPLGQMWGFDLQAVDARTTWVSHMMRVPAYAMPNLPPWTLVAKRGAEHEARNMKPTLRNLARMANAQLLGEIRVTHDWCVSDAPCGKAGSILRAA
jgi:hypothetical protein